MKSDFSVWVQNISAFMPVKQVSWPVFFISLLVFLALSRWNLLQFLVLERGYLEIGLVTLALLSALWLSGCSLRLLRFPLFSFLILLVFVFWAGYTAFWSPVWVKTLGKAYGLLAVAGVALLLAFYTKQRQTSSHWAILLSLFGTVLFLFAINFNRWGEFFFPNPALGRESLTLGTEHANGAVGYLAALALLGLDRACAANELRLRRIIPLGISLFALFLLTFTESRTGIFAASLSVGLFFLFRFRQERILKILAGLALAILLVFLILSAFGLLQPWWQSFVHNNQEIATLNGRTILWKMSIDEVNNSPFGIGYFSTWQFFQSKTSHRFNFDWVFHAHNAFVEILLTTGYLGAALFLLFLFSITPVLGRAFQFPLAVSLAVYVFLDSITEVNFFAPTILMYIFCLFIFSSQMELNVIPGAAE